MLPHIQEAIDVTNACIVEIDSIRCCVRQEFIDRAYRMTNMRSKLLIHGENIIEANIVAYEYMCMAHDIVDKPGMWRFNKIRIALSCLMERLLQNQKLENQYTFQLTS
jgi:hypothetical protein